MKKQHYTAEIPVSNPYNFAAFEDLIANIQSGYNEEKRLKNAAFEFMTIKAYTSISTNGCTTPPGSPKAKISRDGSAWALPRPPGSQNFSGGKCPASAMAPGLHFRGPFPYSASPATDRVTTEKG